MSQMLSLTKYEHQVLPKLRDQLNHSESVEDVKKFFVSIVQEFISLATDGKVTADYVDITLMPEESPFYSVGTHLTESAEIKSLENSDFNVILGRFAEQATHRYMHLMKNNSKTNLKIKHH
jgi:hypothetical protein